MHTHTMATEPFPDEFRAAIFLAGPTPRSSNVPSWRPAALELLADAGYEGAVLDPEPRGGDWHGDYDHQIAWETEGLTLADVIVFWIPRELTDMPAFTTNVEFGSWLRSGKVVCGSPPDAPKNRYLIELAAAEGVDWHDTLDDTITAAVTEAQRHAALRRGPERYVPAAVWHTESFQGWLGDLRDAGHTLDDITVTHQHPARVGHPPFLWVAHPHIGIAGEGRSKTNEIVVGRPDISAVVAHGPLTDPLEHTELVTVAEFRSAGRQPGGLVVELPSGSSPTGGEPTRNAADELREETGLDIDAGRLTHVSSRQLNSTLCTHRCHLYRVELTADELEAARRHTGPIGDLVDDGEVTYVAVTTVAEITADGVADYSTLGMIHTALADARDAT